MQFLENSIRAYFPYKDVNVQPYRYGYIINTETGKKFAKMSRFSQDRLLFVHSVKEYLAYNGFYSLDRYDCTIEGKPFFEAENEIYTISPLYTGKECDFDDKKDIIDSVDLLAYMHKAARGYKAAENFLTYSKLGELPILFEKRVNELKKLKKSAEREKKGFDYLFLCCFNYYYNSGVECIERLRNSKYNEMVKTTAEEGMICHHDFTYQNLVYMHDILYITNFECCSIELKVYDIVNLIRRKMRKCNWSIKEAEKIISAYSKIESLSKEEIDLIGIMLQFPQKFWRVVNKYYNSKRSWAQQSYIARLNEVVQEKECHSIFMNEWKHI